MSKGRLLLVLLFMLGAGGGLVYLTLVYAPLKPIESPCAYFVLAEEDAENGTRNFTVRAPTTWSHDIEGVRIRLDLIEKREILPTLTDAARPEGVKGIRYLDLVGDPERIENGDALLLSKDAAERVQSAQYPLLQEAGGTTGVVLGPGGKCA